MGLFARRPVPALPDREDLEATLRRMSPGAAEEIRNKRYLAEACLAIPDDERVVALLPSGVNNPPDRGLLCATTRALLYIGELREGIRLSLDSFYEVGIIHHGSTLKVAYGAQEAHFGAPHRDEISREFFVRQLRDAVERVKNAAKAPAAKPSDADELAKFAALRDQGVLTDSEFEVKKAELLGKIW